MQGEIGIEPTEACKEVALLGANGLLCLIDAMVVGRAYMEVYDVSPGKTFEGLGALVVYAEVHGLDSMV